LARRAFESSDQSPFTLSISCPAHGPAENQSEVEEAAQRLTERTEQLRVADRERTLLAEIDHALAKFDAGTHGVIEKTGTRISFERLNAIPWARQGADE
jgi:DnaK suppressor protein